MPDVGQNIEELVSRYLTFWDKADIEGIMSMYSPEIQYYDMQSAEMLQSNEIKAFLVDAFSQKTNWRLKLNESITFEGNSAFIYWTQSFTATDTGREVSIHGVELIFFRDNQIHNIYEFYDFHDTETEPATLPSKGTYLEKMAKLGLTDPMMEQLVTELTGYLKDDEPYLQPELTLATVSDHLGYTRNQVSFVINHVLDKTFYDLVNGLRIDHIIARMSSSELNLSILELGFDAGFNSVSGFYNAFKKQTGMTPAQYKRQIKSARE